VQKPLLCWDHSLNDVLFSVNKADALCGKGYHARNISTRLVKIIEKNTVIV
jgi:hypothetical protein